VPAHLINEQQISGRSHSCSRGSVPYPRPASVRSAVGQGNALLHTDGRDTRFRSFFKERVRDAWIAHAPEEWFSVVAAYVLQLDCSGPLCFDLTLRQIQRLHRAPENRQLKVVLGHHCAFFLLRVSGNGCTTLILVSDSSKTIHTIASIPHARRKVSGPSTVSACRMEGIQVIDEHLTGLAKGIALLKGTDMTGTIKEKGVVVSQHAVLSRAVERPGQSLPARRRDRNGKSLCLSAGSMLHALGLTSVRASRRRSRQS